MAESEKRERKEKKPDACLKFADFFGIDVAVAEGKNFVFSPLSIRLALSLAAAGARGSTLEEFLAFFDSGSLDDLNSSVEGLLASVNTTVASRPYIKEMDAGRARVSLATSLWVDEAWTMKESFKEIAASVYDAEARSVDIKHKPENVAREVNDWAANKTNGLIRSPLPPRFIEFRHGIDSGQCAPLQSELGRTILQIFDTR